LYMTLKGRIIRYRTETMRNSISILIKLLNLSIKSPFLTDAEHFRINFTDMYDTYIFSNIDFRYNASLVEKLK
jgi:hypothetical protein